ncbi:uncharacterized protein [Nicotiana tomentosiformis]|uniref:uncharacterized protein n=1 Tax=Nicotiana tomentosiformis TaxID=4098 RepID=UPI00388CAB34
MTLNNEPIGNLPLGEEVDDDQGDEVLPEPQANRQARPPQDNVPVPAPPPPRAAVHRVFPNEGYASAIVPPRIRAGNIQITNVMLTLLEQCGFFTGAPNQNAYKYLKGFVDTCWGSKQTNVTEDALRLRLFPSSLRGKALEWLERMPNHWIHTWDDFAERFIAKFFSPGHMATLRDKFLAFKQEPNEPLHEIWERYRTRVKECPNIDMTESMIQQTFYRGINSTNQCVELHDLGQVIAELTSTMNQLAKALLQQVQGPKQVNALEGVNMMMNKRRQKGQGQRCPKQFMQDDSEYDQGDSYNEQEEEVKFVTNYQEDEIPNNVVQANDEVRIDIDENLEEMQEEVNPSWEHMTDIPEPVVPKAKAPVPRPPPPCPQSLAKQNSENQLKRFIHMMKRLSINVPLVEALEQMSGYAKFMKDLVTKKRSMNCETINIKHQVSAIVHSMAPKLEDPGAFTIP